MEFPLLTLLQMIWKSRLAPKKKWALSVMFSGGLLIMVFGLLRCILILKVRFPADIERKSKTQHLTIICSPEPTAPSKPANGPSANPLSQSLSTTFQCSTHSFNTSPAAPIRTRASVLNPTNSPLIAPVTRIRSTARNSGIRSAFPMTRPTAATSK